MGDCWLSNVLHSSSMKAQQLKNRLQKHPYCRDNPPFFPCFTMFVYLFMWKKRASTGKVVLKQPFFFVTALWQQDHYFMLYNSAYFSNFSPVTLPKRVAISPLYRPYLKRNTFGTNSQWDYCTCFVFLFFLRPGCAGGLCVCVFCVHVRCGGVF